MNFTFPNNSPRHQSNKLNENLFFTIVSENDSDRVCIYPLVQNNSTPCMRLKNETIRKKVEFYSFSSALKDYKKERKSRKIRFLINFYFLSNCFGEILYFLISYIDYFLPCSEDSIAMVVYKNIVKITCELMFYPLFGYFLIFPWIFKKISSKKIAQFVKSIIIFLMFLIVTIFQILYEFKILPNYLMLHLTVFLVANIGAFVVCKRNNVKFSEIKHYYFIFAILITSLMFNYYVMKKEIIVWMSEKGYYKKYEVAFKIFFFIYFNLYRRLINFLLIKFFKLGDVDTYEHSNDAISVFLNYFIGDIMCSTVVPVIVGCESLMIVLLNLCVFAYQLIIFYCGRNFLIEYFWKIVNYLFNRKENKDENKALHEKCRELFTRSLNEVMIIIYLKLILLAYFKKFHIESRFMQHFSDVCRRFNSNISIQLDTLLLLFMINVLVGGTVYLSNRKVKEMKLAQDFMIKNERLRVFKKIYHVIIIFSYIENYYQFYFYLALENHVK